MKISLVLLYGFVLRHGLKAALPCRSVFFFFFFFFFNNNNLIDFLLNVQITAIVQQSVIPTISNGNQCYLVSTRFFPIIYVSMFNYVF
jgi:hypothetical protein